MKHRSDTIMWDRLFRLQPGSSTGLQVQLREQMVRAILDGHLAPDSPLPSCRELARQLGVARNTVVLAYQHLVDVGYLVARERSGYFVNRDILRGRVQGPVKATDAATAGAVDWAARFRVHPTAQRNISKPADWQRYPYPFLYGQPDPTLFPIHEWRECCRQALSVREVRELARDRFDRDDPLLIEQIQTRVLPRRGVFANPDQILVTLGAQNALYLLACLLVGAGQRVGVEDPGYVDARNIFALRTANVVPLPVDGAGLVVDQRLADCELVYVTPSHQAPTTVTMSLERRRALLEAAEAHDLILIEDDYESETNYLDSPTPALKSLDRGERVVYIGSLSKTLDPGLRVGYMVGPAALIEEVRALRRLMLRHPPANNQRAVALFLSLGHHDALLLRLAQAYQRRWAVMGETLEQHLPDAARLPTFGGTSYWVRGPADLDARALQQRAAAEGILIEPGDLYFAAPEPPRNYLRLGYSSIAEERIAPGLRKLAELIRTR